MSTSAACKYSLIVQQAQRFRPDGLEPKFNNRDAFSRAVTLEGGLQELVHLRVDVFH